MKKDTVTFTDDQKAVLLKALKDIHFANSQLHKWVNEGTLSEEMAANMPALIESYFSEAAKVLNYESHLLKEKEKRHIEIRKANETIRELREQLGSNKPIDGLPEQLTYLKDKVYEWWQKEGFNHVSEERFLPYGGLRLEFCFMLDSRHFSSTSKTPVTDERNDKEHIQHLRDMGFEFNDEDTDRMGKLMLIDNPHNRSLLLKMLRERFPSIEVHRWDNRSSHSNPDVFTIWHIDATIYDLKDI